MPKTTAFSGRVVAGQLVPDISAIKQVMKGLRTDAAKDPALRRAWERNPRSVLGSLGLPRIIQNQILEEEGRSVRWSTYEKELASGCYGCSGCCCSGCSYSG